MWNLPFSRGPALVRAVGAVVAGLFGVLWTILALSLTADAPFPTAVKWIFPAAGLLFTLAAWMQAAWLFIHAASEQKYAQDDDQPQGADGTSAGYKPSDEGTCSRCHAPLRLEYHYCPHCGQKRV
ncbi:MAG: zinc ribbon domain-containing protein [Planctomycetaceae bacterium]